MMEQQKLHLNGVMSVRCIGQAEGDVERNAKADISYNNFPTIPFYKADLKSGPISNPGTVPFLWEQSPGRPKHERKKSVDRNSEMPPIAPRLPPGRRRNGTQKHEPVKRPDCSKTNRADQLSKSSDVKAEKLGCSSKDDDDDDVYADANDTLESLFEKCSVSESSRMDGDLILSGTVAAAPQNVGVMMGRFLPATKAMTSETPRQSSKNFDALSGEHSKQGTSKAAKHMATPDKKPQLLRYLIQNDIEEHSDENMDEDDHSNISGKGCGVLPRLCLLSPVPVLRVFPQAKAKSVRRVPAISIKNHGLKSVAEISATKIHENRSSHRVQSVYTQNESLQSNDKQMAEASSETTQVSNFVDGPKNFKTFQDFLMDHSAEHESPPVVEKTIYIDSGHMTETTCSFTVSNKYEHVPDKIHISENVISSDSSVHEIKYLSVADENETKAFQAEATSPIHPSKTATVIYLQNDDLVTNKCLVEHESAVKGMLTHEESKAQARQHKDITSNPQLALPCPPPLPNSPSDSWLCRTLPSISSKKKSFRSHHGSPTQKYKKHQAPRQEPESKWETMVKSSKPLRHHLPYSEAMLSPIPEA